MAKHKDLTGQVFGRLTVLKEVGKTKPGEYLWECVCSCEAHTICVVPGRNLTHGNTKSCGCLHKELIIKRNKAGRKYFWTNERIFRIWSGMKERCYNQSQYGYYRYGARSIKICKEWLDDYSAFESWALANGYADNLTIDRIDYDGDYCPENCRWVTWSVQSNNRQDNKMLEYKGKIQSLANWCRELNLDYYRTKARLNNLHWSVEEAFEQPKYKKTE